MSTRMIEFFARLQKKKDVKATVRACKDLGLQVEETDETVKVTSGEETVYAALLKDADTWICRLNKDYFVE